MKEGKPYVMFGDGTLAACKPISEQDLASFIADCVSEVRAGWGAAGVMLGCWGLGGEQREPGGVPSACLCCAHACMAVVCRYLPTPPAPSIAHTTHQPSCTPLLHTQALDATRCYPLPTRPITIPFHHIHIPACIPSTQTDKINQVLPIGGPGAAMTAKDQADLLFGIAGLPPKYFPVPVALMDGIIGILDFMAKFFPGMKVGGGYCLGPAVGGCISASG